MPLAPKVLDVVREVRARLRSCDPAWLATFWPAGEARGCESLNDLREWLIRVSVDRTTAAAVDGGEAPRDLARLFYLLSDAASRCAQIILAEEQERLAVGARPQGHETAG